MQASKDQTAHMKPQNRKAVEDLVMQFRIERAARRMGKITDARPIDTRFNHAPLCTEIS
jgi:hypothetical protein